jgi:nucleoside-diphosphate kinase
LERTLIIVKPDGVQRGLVGEIVTRLERRGLRLVGLKLTQIDNALARQHYGEHEGKPFFNGLIEYITSGPVLVGVIEGTNAIEAVRATMGVTNPAKSAPGTIRGDLAIETGRNLIHGSDSSESAAKEIARFFQKEELLSYTRDADKWIYE